MSGRLVLLLLIAVGVVLAHVPSALASGILTVDPAQVTVDEGQEFTLTFTLTNNGPGDISSIQVAVVPSGEVSGAAPSAGTYSQDGIWNVDGLPAGASASLRVTASVSNKPAVGAAVISAAGVYRGAELLNEDGTPSGARPDEVLSRASATVNVRPGLPHPSLMTTVRPRHDDTPPFVITIGGVLKVPPADRKPGWCTGTVRVSLGTREQLKTRVVVKELVGATTRLVLHGTRCAVKRRLVIPTRAALNGYPSLIAQARFSGNARLRPVVSGQKLVLVVPVGI